MPAVRSQFTFSEELPGEVSLHPYAKMINLGKKELPFYQVMKQFDNLAPKPIAYENVDLGFSSDHYWVKFELKNDSPYVLDYYLETGRPITDSVTLYSLSSNGSFLKMVSGDKMPVSARAYPHRKSVFRIDMLPQESQTIFIHLKSDGEVLQLPLILRNAKTLLQLSMMEQLVFGIFYGILLLAAVVYLFFYFGMRQSVFLYYGFYVVFIGLLQFSLDGYFYQYIAPSGGWLSLRAVLLSATLATFFLGRYSEVFLNIGKNSPKLRLYYKLLYAMTALSLVFLVVTPDISLGYPMANALGLFELILIITSVVILYRKKVAVDPFFTVGIFFLVAGFVIFILNNFGQIPTSFWSQNSSKFGTGLEVIFLSLSMANLIARLRSEREEFNRLALERAEEMNEMKTYFLSNISHELRTPLNAIMSLSTEISKTTADEKIRHNSQVIKYSSNSLLSSVNDILDFSKIEKDELKLEPVNFEPVRVLEHIKNNMALRAADQGLEFVFEKADGIPQMLHGDVTRLGQIVNNVLSNAIKFTPQGTVKFSISAVEAEPKKSRLQIIISDTGVGIAKDKMTRIFESFTQDSINNKRKYGGLGLGLYIAKTLVEMQSGTIRMQSTPGVGTTCTISIDYPVIEVKPVEAPQPATEFDLGPTKILVVEDNAINQMVIKMILKKWQGVESVYANNGQEGLDALSADGFDLILMDLQMPVMDGYEATIAIRSGRAGDHYTNIPIIAVTADVMETTKATVKDIGMDGYLSKPLKNETLFEMVRSVLARSA